MSRPVCVHCGTPYGIRATEPTYFVCSAKEPTPPYTGNQKVTRERHWIPSGSGSISGIKYSIGDRVVQRDLWDGHTYIGVKARPFCTTRCALSYARKAYAAHLQNTGEDHD